MASSCPLDVMREQNTSIDAYFKTLEAKKLLAEMKKLIASNGLIVCKRTEESPHKTGGMSQALVGAVFILISTSLTTLWIGSTSNSLNAQLTHHRVNNICSPNVKIFDNMIASVVGKSGCSIQAELELEIQKHLVQLESVQLKALGLSLTALTGVGATFTPEGTAAAAAVAIAAASMAAPAIMNSGEQAHDEWVRTQSNERCALRQYRAPAPSSSHGRS